MGTAKTPTKKAKVQPKVPVSSAKKQSVPKKSEPVSELDPQTYVVSAKLTESLSVVRKLQDLHTTKKSEKKDLFESDNSFVSLQVDLKKIPANYTTFIHTISLPAHWRHALAIDTCLIVPDLNREPLEDRDLDLEETKAKYMDILEEADASELIKEILPMRQLRNEFRPPALRQKLSSEFNIFLCDRKLLQNKYSFLSRFLGKAFWVDHKKVPLMIDFSVERTDLRRQIEEKLNQTNLYVSGKGSSLSVCVGSLEQKPKDLLANLQAILNKVNDIFGDNVRALTVKTAKSDAVTFYMDLASSNAIDVMKKSEENTNEPERFVEDEFDFLTNSSVRVYRDGTIQVRKRKAPEGEEEDEEEADASELKLIKGINRTRDYEWVRRKVSNMKVARDGMKRSKRMVGRGGKRFFSKGKKKAGSSGKKTTKKETKVAAKV